MEGKQDTYTGLAVTYNYIGAGKNPPFLTGIYCEFAPYRPLLITLTA